MSRIQGWLVDLGIVYGAAILFGAPVGLVAVRVSRTSVALTASIIIAFVGFLVTRRRKRRAKTPP